MVEADILLLAHTVRRVGHEQPLYRLETREQLLRAADVLFQLAHREPDQKAASEGQTEDSVVPEKIADRKDSSGDATQKPGSLQVKMTVREDYVNEPPPRVWKKNGRI
jgi:hypothetical protein